MLSKILFCALFFPLSVLADANLAVTCEAGASTDSPRSACTRTVYAKPVAQTLVRALLTDTWRPFGAVAAGATIEVCQSNIPAGSLSVDGAPCTAWGPLAAGSVPQGIPPAVSTTFQLTWDAVTNTPVRGYKLYSAAMGVALTQLGGEVTVLKVQLSGYGPGSYSFAVAAIGTDGVEGPMSNKVDISVAAMAIVPAKVQNLVITEVK